MADETKEGSETGGNGKADDARIMEQVDARLAKGEARMIVADLMRENFESRDKIRDLKKQVPGDGAVVLKGDDAKDYETYRSFGKPSDIRKGLEKGAESERENAGHRRDKSLSEVADLIYPGKAKVLARALPVDAEFLVKEVKDPKTGKTSKVPFLKPRAEGEEPVAVSKFIEDSAPELLPSLTGTTTPAPRPNTTPAPRTFGGNAPPADVMANEIAARQATGQYRL